MIDPVDYDLNRHLAQVEREERIWEALESALEPILAEIADLAQEARDIAESVLEEQGARPEDYSSEIYDMMRDVL